MPLAFVFVEACEGPDDDAARLRLPFLLALELDIISRNSRLSQRVTYGHGVLNADQRSSIGRRRSNQLAGVPMRSAPRQSCDHTTGRGASMYAYAVCWASHARVASACRADWAPPRGARISHTDIMIISRACAGFKLKPKLAA